MKHSAKKIQFCPADKLRNQIDTGKGFFQGPNYTTTHSRITALNGEEFFVVKITTRGDHEGLNVDNLVAKLNKINHRHLYSLQCYSHELNLDDKLRRNWSIWFLFEPFKSTLEEVIIHKREIDSKFSEISLITFMKDAVSLLAYLKTLKVSYRAIHPRNFIVTPDDVVKFDALDLSPYDVFHSNINTQTSKAFLAPEELSSSHVDHEKTEVFRLGLVLLHTALLKDLNEANRSEGLIKNLVADVAKKYSKYLAEMLKKMLIFDPNNRVNIQELYHYTKQPQEDTSGSESAPNNSEKKAARTVNFQEDLKEPKKESVYKLCGSIDSILKDSKRGIDRKSSKEEESKNQATIKDSSPTKMKTIEMETLRSRLPLQISNSREGHQFQLFHTFIVGTRNLIVVPLVTLKNLFIEVIELDIPFEIPRHHMSVYSKNGRIYILGGEPSRDQDSNCYYYEDGQITLVEQNSFSEKVRLKAGVCSIGDCIYLMGGSTMTAGRFLNTCEVFDIKNNLWRTIASMKSRCAEASFCNFSDKYIFRFGGIDGAGQIVNMIEKYSISEDQWTEVNYLEDIGRLRLSKAAFSAQVNEEEILVFGGVDAQGSSNRQAFMLNCGNTEVSEEVISFVDENSPRRFSIDPSSQNQVAIMGKEIVFLSESASFSRVCSFDGEVFKELKKVFQ